MKQSKSKFKGLKIETQDLHQEVTMPKDLSNMNNFTRNLREEIKNKVNYPIETKLNFPENLTINQKLQPYQKPKPACLTSRKQDNQFQSSNYFVSPKNMEYAKQQNLEINYRLKTSSYAEEKTSKQNYTNRFIVQKSVNSNKDINLMISKQQNLINKNESTANSNPLINQKRNNKILQLKINEMAKKAPKLDTQLTSTNKMKNLISPQGRFGDQNFAFRLQLKEVSSRKNEKNNELLKNNDKNSEKLPELLNVNTPLSCRFSNQSINRNHTPNSIWQGSLSPCSQIDKMTDRSHEKSLINQKNDKIQTKLPFKFVKKHEKKPTSEMPKLNNSQKSFEQYI